MIPTDVHTLRHGYNLADLDRLAKMALWRSWGMALDFDTRYEVAWSAIAEHLYTVAERPAPDRLVGVAQGAISEHFKDLLHHHGVDRPWRGGGPMPRFLMYWELARRSRASHETGVVERVALWQIWEQLSPTHRDVLLAMAIHGDQRAAAAMVDKGIATFRSHLKNARQEFRALWHEGEKPSVMWGRDDRRHTQATAMASLRQRQARRKERVA